MALLPNGQAQPRRCGREANATPAREHPARTYHQALRRLQRLVTRAHTAEDALAEEPFQGKSPTKQHQRTLFNRAGALRVRGGVPSRLVCQGWRGTGGSGGHAWFLGGRALSLAEPADGHRVTVGVQPRRCGRPATAPPRGSTPTQNTNKPCVGCNAGLHGGPD